jgi:transposase
MTTELAWSWRRFQPESALSVWCRARFGSGGKRLRRIGIVAVARKLLMALWRFLATGVLPEGAVLKEGEALGGCGVTPWSEDWWRRPVEMPGLRSTPS